jgi:hypothetical protein
MPLPDFLVIGVPKAGTTALHVALSRHPELFLPACKEPKFFLTGEHPMPSRGGPGDVQTYRERHVWRRSEYEALFSPAPPGSLTGEATPFYLYDLDAQNRIHRLIPHARLIAVLRNPVDRAFSNWVHMWAAGLEEESDFLAACWAERWRMANGYAHFWHYVGQGMYGHQFEHLFRLFPRDQVLILRYREVRDAPAETLDRVCEFLGVRTGIIGSVPRENVSPYVADTPVNAMLRAALRSGGKVGYRFPRTVRTMFRGPLLTALTRPQRGERRRVTPEQRAALLPSFAEDIKLLEKVTDLSFSDWLALE